MKEYIQDALDARDVLTYIVGWGEHRKHWLEPDVQIVGFSLGKRDYAIDLQDEALRASFQGQIGKAREVIAKRKAEAR